MGRLAILLAACAASVLALPPQWCCVLPITGDGKVCCQCCEACAKCGGYCCQKPTEEHPARHKENPCTCGNDPIKQGEKAAVAILPIAEFVEIVVDFYSAAVPVVDRDSSRNLQKLLCRWRC